MSRSAWPDVDTSRGAFHLLVGRLDDTFEGGAQEKFDSSRLRFASNLMKRCVTSMTLHGTVAVQASREDGQSVVLIAIEDPADLAQLTALTGSTVRVGTGWKSEHQFNLDHDCHTRLLTVGGPPDERGAGRREHLRRAAEQDERSLRWKVRDGE
jgi:hypothetical protein